MSARPHSISIHPPFAACLLRLLFAAALLLGLGSGVASAASPAAPAVGSPYPVTPLADWWMTDGRVNALVSSGNTLYLGGEFTHISLYLGGGVPIGKVNGLPQTSAPHLEGIVYAIVPDGSGG